MKRSTIFLLVFCLVVGMMFPAFAAKPTFIKQIQMNPDPAVVGKKLTLKVNVKNQDGLTWYFVNPETGVEFSARNVSKAIKGIKISGPNNKTMTIKKALSELEGWSVYCQISGNGHKVKSDPVTITFNDSNAAAAITASESSVADEPIPEESSPSDNEYDSGISEEAAELPEPETESDIEPETVEEIVPEQSEPAEPESVGDAEPGQTETPEADIVTDENEEAIQIDPADPSAFVEGEAAPDDEDIGLEVKPFTVTADGISLYLLDRKGKPSGEPQSELYFEEAGDFAAKAEGIIQYITINGIQLVTDGEISEVILRNVSNDMTISARVIKSKVASAESSVTATNPGSDSNAFASESAAMVTVTCERCRFTGGGNKNVQSGSVPVGTQITVITGSNGNTSAGYSINGGAYDHKNMITFKYVVTGDTVITMNAN